MPRSGDSDHSSNPTSPVDERLVRLPVTTVIRVLRLVESGMYPTFDSAVAAALEQLTLRSVESHRASDLPPKPPKLDRTVSELRIVRNPDLPPPTLRLSASLSSVSPVPPAPLERSAWKLVAFTAPRFLPVKAALRLIARDLERLGNSQIGLDETRDRVGYEAMDWGVWLSELDRHSGRPRGERLATGFPTGGREDAKSIRRFLDAYVGWTYRDGRITGAATYLGYASVSVGSEGRSVVGLTESGLRFARLPNDVLDRGEGSFPPFSPEEVDLLLNDIAKRCRLEAEHFAQYLLLLRDRPGVSREAATASMRGFYERIWDPTQLTGALVESMRMAVHSRSQELGLAETVREGKGVSYHLTERGLHSIDTLRESLKVIPEAGI